MAQFRIEFKNPTDFQHIEADFWTLDAEAGWFDFYQNRDAGEEILVMTVNSGDVRTIIRHEVPSLA